MVSTSRRLRSFAMAGSMKKLTGILTVWPGFRVCCVEAEAEGDLGEINSGLSRCNVEGGDAGRCAVIEIPGGIGDEPALADRDPDATRATSGWNRQGRFGLVLLARNRTVTRAGADAAPIEAPLRPAGSCRRSRSPGRTAHRAGRHRRRAASCPRGSPERRERCSVCLLPRSSVPPSSASALSPTPDRI